MRKVESIKSVYDLHLDSQTAMVVVEREYSVARLINAARYDKLEQLPGIGKARAARIYAAVDEAGFILHESITSAGIRALLVKTFGEPLETPDNYELRTEFTTEQRDSLFELFEILTRQEAEVLKLRFGLDGSGPMTLKAIGKILNVSGERARAVEALALRKLRHYKRKPQVAEIFLNWPGFIKEPSPKPQL